MRLVLDTHAAVFWTCLPELLSDPARTALQEAELIGVPAIAFWETALLVRRRKLDLGMPVEEWASKVRMIPRCEAVPLTAEISIRADALQLHPDPADRFIVATALALDAALLTKDAAIHHSKLVKTIW